MKPLEDLIIFQHQSPKDLKTLRPLTYAELEKVRGKDYTEGRKPEDETYRKLIGGPKTRSFLYASPFGFTDFDSPEDYPGFTYYFRLNRKQIDRCAFSITSGAIQGNTSPHKGMQGLLACMKFWTDNQDQMTEFDDPGVGLIEPRVNAVIPFEVNWFTRVLEVEQR